ncbi:BTB/POZ domain-containing protein 2 [Toxorhynchites rutilus septentrionalis]|uniref:BTB/POZ domain-containing protein 2 n=1 Tax=Toxorhynchites rutilus septentrionalis TaxID=329112 RepID=UPI002479C6DF|nr:BTB/POZ domain-containing protein 2 [Toxorhynchites rutilus septentrionalis]XP_055628117.1 BTB/POZ domain-containing protein 2 [Toxorhynchites rutilus septentrionalis]XP_055628118.1 BTB/POZ domain-containing protein 2 [Toxorhynchites rutilus septentrionalis]XP_055628119.1 BTB/POZ domain-containing protein 2 [Toxorhynchites rutilus septentrionalis]XP_055628120.1 BTB/POZ domain-containing protein 2 [Toxorhynchites rutilus septentrionalis]
MVRPFNTSSENGGDQARALLRPTAPPLIQVNAEGDDFSDPDAYVEFLVLGNKENYSVRAEKKPILDSNTLLAHIINGAVPSTTIVDGKFVVRDVDKDIFEIFVRYLETKYIKFISASHTLQTLELASRFQCRQLEICCVKELDLNLSIDCVLEVFRALWYYNSFTPAGAITDQRKKRWRPSSSRSKKNETVEDRPLTPEEYFAALLNNCLQLIDMHPEDVFAQPAMLVLRFEELEMIAKREALQMSSEMVLLDLLVRWSREECSRKNLELTAENRRRVLGALCFSPRYLTMSRKEFEGARDRIMLLDPVELKLVGDVLNGKRASSLTPEQQTMVANFKRPRPAFAPMPIQLSARSNPKNYPKKMRKAAEEAASDKHSCCERLIIGFVSVFACIFD